MKNETWQYCRGGIGRDAPPLAAAKPARIARRPGIVLILVLVVVVTLSLSAYTFSSLMLTHRRAAKLTGQQLQTRMLVDSGVEMVKYYLMQDEASREQMGGHFNNPIMFQGITVVPAADFATRGSFSIVSPLSNTSMQASGTMGAAMGMGMGTGMGGSIRFGLEDESARLNLNLVLLAGESARNLMMGIPGMTEDVADSILDWMDEDDTPRDYGAERDYYAALNPPYEPRNGPLVTVEELLLVRGVTPGLLFGQDQNRNTMMDQHELNVGASGATSTMADAAAMTSLGMTSHRGWSGYLTIYSAEKNARADEQPRINVNGDDMQLLHDDLVAAGFSEEWANFIIAYRIYGPAGGSGNEGQGAGGRNSGDQNSGNSSNSQVRPASEIELDLESSPAPTAQINQLLDLIGAQVQIGGGGGNESDGDGGQNGGRDGQDQGGGQSGQRQGDQGERQGGQGQGQGGQGQGQSGQGGGGGQARIYASPFVNDPREMATYLPLLMDTCTVTDVAVIPGRININDAPPEILLGIPGMTEEIVSNLMNQRAVISSDVTPRDNETWLLAEGVVTLSEMKALHPYLCAGGDVFRAQIVGYFQGAGPSTRVEVVFDATAEQPQIVLWRDISHLGRGYALEMLGIDLTSAQ